MENQTGDSMTRDRACGGAQLAPARAARPAMSPASERHVWAIAALFFPLVFCAIVGLGVYLMFHRQMAFFKPAPSGSGALAPHWASIPAGPRAGA